MKETPRRNRQPLAHRIFAAIVLDNRCLEKSGTAVGAKEVVVCPGNITKCQKEIGENKSTYHYLRS